MTPPSQAVASPIATEINSKLTSIALQSSTEYRLGPEDLLQITLYNVPETEVGATPRKLEARISQQGDISLPLLGDIPAQGLTTSALEQRLQERYKKYLRDPQIGVFVKEYHSQRVSVIGEVQKPGVFELSGPKTLIDLLAMAGGVNDKAGRQVYLFRQGPTGRESSVIDLYALANRIDGANPPVQAGDVINVPRAGMFFVDGAVRHPGPFSLNRPYTLTQALTSAGGVDTEIAKTSNITIIRLLDSAERETVAVNLDAIVAGKAVDPEIKAEDVIIVPTSTTKYLVKRFVGPLISGVPILPYNLFY
jgi:polysaccharide export outer membrane protein